MKFKIIVLLFLLSSCRKQCVEKNITVAKFTVDYDFYQIETEIIDKIIICGTDTIFKYEYISKKTIPKQGYIWSHK